MAASNTVWGIDLGQCGLKAIRLRAEGDTVQVVDHVYIEHARILSQPEVDRAGLIAEAMKQFTSRHDLSRERLFVGVQGQHTLARFSRLPPVDRKKIPEIVRYEAQQQIPFDLDEVIWDYQVLGTEPTGEINVGIFAIRRELLREHLQFLFRLNLEPAGVQAAPLALYNALRFDGLCGGSEAVAILDIGTQNADLIACDGDSLWTRNIPIGGNSFTEALQKTFKLSFRKAENLKRDAAKSKYARQIFVAMRPVFADLVAEIQRSLGYYTASSSRRGVRITRLLAMGSAFKLPGMQKFIQQNLGMEVERPRAFSRLSMASAPDAEALSENLMSFGVACGLALQGLGRGQIASNLLPPEIARQVIWRKKTPLFYGAAAGLALSAVIVWGRNITDAGVVAAHQDAGSDRAIAIPEVPEDRILEQLRPAEEALRVIAQGPTGSGPLEKARQVLAVDKHFKEVLNRIQQANQSLLAQAEELSDLRAQQPVWPRILWLVHSCLPAGDRELVEAWKQGPEAYRRRIEQGGARFERGKREQILIRDFSVEFIEGDVIAAYEARTQGTAGQSPGPGGLAMPSEPAGGAASGFIITILGQTPHADPYGFINRAFLSRIKDAATEGVYLHGGRLDRCWKVGSKDAAGFRSQLPGGGTRQIVRPAFDTGMGTAGGELIDPVTRESTVNDSEFTVILAAVLADKPKEEAAGGAGARAAPLREE